MDTGSLLRRSPRRRRTQKLHEERPSINRTRAPEPNEAVAETRDAKSAVPLLGLCGRTSGGSAR
eukprot:5469558-Alexandrium_andersonii.AAC.1